MPITLSPGEQRELNVQMAAIPPELAVLHGRVTDQGTGQPISNARVDLVGDFTYFAFTNADGYYQIVDIQPGQYSATFSHADYETVVI